VTLAAHAGGRAAMRVLTLDVWGRAGDHYGLPAELTQASMTSSPNARATETR
jgi:hypothetical protein